MYVAQVTAGTMPNWVYLPARVFAVSGGIAFSTGTSWGTFAIMLPIAVPAAADSGPPPRRRSSPLRSREGSSEIIARRSRDTTIISSMAAATDHIDHVRTQLPYALVGGGDRHGLLRHSRSHAVADPAPS